MTYTELIADSASLKALYSAGLLETYVGFLPISVPEVVFSYGCLPLPLARKRQLVDAGLKVLSTEPNCGEVYRLKENNPVVGIVDCFALHEANLNPNLAVLTDDHWILSAAAKDNIQTASFTNLQQRMAKELRQEQRRQRSYRPSRPDV